MVWISAISLLFLLLIAFFDFRTRQIPIILLCGETVASFSLGYTFIGFLVLKVALTASLMVAFQFIILWLYIKLRNRSCSSSSVWSDFGKGDLFMLVISALNISALNYLLFIVVVSIFTILIWLGFSRYRNVDCQSIPFAGYIAIGLMIIRIIQYTKGGFILYSDDYLTNLIHGIN